MMIPAQSLAGQVAAEPLRRIVVESLERELRSRRDRLPHAQLGVMVGAERAAVERAYVRLRAQFDPRFYQVHGAVAEELAREIAGLLDAAVLHFRSPMEDRARPRNPLSATLRWLARLF
jgi:hypothetical protein